ncbi:hypothetical protein [Thioalkalivibrio sp. HK1]|uniref:hypothetical protein n=1 Tax=Thioalkalivibrio sp. HK1 TaxID=1469245 RepID=UPI0005703BE0|nr:hypothetical protein [Thioalkalivibrio sp. HK1]
MPPDDIQANLGHYRLKERGSLCGQILGARRKGTPLFASPTLFRIIGNNIRRMLEGECWKDDAQTESRIIFDSEPVIILRKGTLTRP